jgi:hypothetical protein
MVQVSQVRQPVCPRCMEDVCVFCAVPLTDKRRGVFCDSLCKNLISFVPEAIWPWASYECCRQCAGYVIPHGRRRLSTAQESGR